MTKDICATATTAQGLRENPLAGAVGRPVAAEESNVGASATGSHDDQPPFLLACAHRAAA